MVFKPRPSNFQRYRCHSDMCSPSPTPLNSFSLLSSLNLTTTSRKQTLLETALSCIVNGWWFETSCTFRDEMVKSLKSFAYDCSLTMRNACICRECCGFAVTWMDTVDLQDLIIKHKFPYNREKLLTRDMCSGELISRGNTDAWHRLNIWPRLLGVQISVRLAYTAFQLEETNGDLPRAYPNHAKGERIPLFRSTLVNLSRQHIWGVCLSLLFCRGRIQLLFILTSIRSS